MRNLPFVVAAAVLTCAAVAVALFVLLRPTATVASTLPGAPPAAGAAGSAELESRVAALQHSVDELRAQVAELARKGVRQPVGVDQEAVRAAVADWLEVHVAELGGAPADGASGPEATAAEAVGQLLQRLHEAGDSEEEWHAIWKEARQQGLLYDLLAAFTTRAERSPGDAQAQSDLGAACLEATQHEEDPMKKGDLAERADKAFDRALALDDHHWEARFLKGLALSFWPSFLGKRSESIRQFEILVEQQESAERDQKHAQSYLYLGNLYEEAGQSDKAKAMWARGLRNFPDDAKLRAKVQ